jgi:hypothetical protein
MGMMPVPLQAIAKDGSWCNAPDHYMANYARGIDTGMSRHEEIV